MSTLIEPLSDTQVEKDVKIALDQQVDLESQVIFHISFIPEEDTAIRIWSSTYLIDHDSNHKSQLLFADKISMFPQWTFLRKNENFNFTLIFSGLPKSCKKFDLQEYCNNQGGEFVIRNVIRNKTDVYHFNYE